MKVKQCSECRNYIRNADEIYEDYTKINFISIIEVNYVLCVKCHKKRPSTDQTNEKN